jgi:hypothetical protein
MLNKFLFLALLVSSPLSANAQSQPKFLDATPLPPMTIDGNSVRVHTQGLFVREDDWLVTGRLESAPKRPLLFRFAGTKKSSLEVVDLTLASDSNVSLDHPGGFDRDANGIFWVPVSTSNRRGPSVILGIILAPDQPLKAMKIVHSIFIDDHVGAVCCMDESKLLAATWDTKTVYRIDTAGRDVKIQTWNQVMKNVPGLAVQDWKFDRQRKMIVASGIDKSTSRKEGDSNAVVAWIDPSSKNATTMRLAPRNDVARPLTNEGMALFNGELYLLPEDMGSGAKVLRFGL